MLLMLGVLPAQVLPLGAAGVAHIRLSASPPAGDGLGALRIIGALAGGCVLMCIVCDLAVWPWPGVLRQVEQSAPTLAARCGVQIGFTEASHGRMP